jgi:hypothetical protein
MVVYLFGSGAPIHPHPTHEPGTALLQGDLRLNRLLTWQQHLILERAPMTVARMLILGIVMTAAVATVAFTGSDPSAIVKGTVGSADIGVRIPPVDGDDLGTGGMGLPSGAATGGLYWGRSGSGNRGTVSLSLVAGQGRRKVRFGLALSLVLVGFAVVGVFIYIPFFSDYAFWVVIAAYVILAAGRGGGDWNQIWIDGATAPGRRIGVSIGELYGLPLAGRAVSGLLARGEAIFAASGWPHPSTTLCRVASVGDFWGGNGPVHQSTEYWALSQTPETPNAPDRLQIMKLLAEEKAKFNLELRNVDLAKVRGGLSATTCHPCHADLGEG